MVGLAASPALAQEPVPTTAPPAASPDAPTATLPTPEPVTAAPNTYSYPRWLPLRTDVDGTEVTVGCTLDSHGSQHGYECAGHHNRWAIDFLADPGTEVYAAGAGFATNLTGKPGGSGFGNVVSIDHGFGITTLYGHLTTALVPPEGAWVDETTIIGTVGQTGSASAPHLHYEVFAGPDGSATNHPESIDPGPLFACRGGFLVSFPQVAGFDSWAGLPWGSLSVASDGHDCATPGGQAKAKAAIARAAERADGPVEPTASTESAESTEDDGEQWSDQLAKAIGLIGSTGSRLALPR